MGLTASLTVCTSASRRAVSAKRSRQGTAAVGQRLHNSRPVAAWQRRGSGLLPGRLPLALLHDARSLAASRWTWLVGRDSLGVGLRKRKLAGVPDDLDRSARRSSLLDQHLQVIGEAGVEGARRACRTAGDDCCAKAPKG
jgi:hypothetical protein